MPLPAFEIAGFLLGLLLGSFLNVCIARIPAGQSIVRPGSHCPVCDHPIRWFDNIPLLSWLLLRARCRDCRAPISWQYPAVELATALWLLWIGSRVQLLWDMSQPAMQTIRAGLGMGTVTSFWQYAPGLVQLLSLALLGLFLIPLAVIDWQTHTLPDAFTLTGTAAALFLVCTETLFLLPGQQQIIFASRHLRLASPGSFSARGNVFLTGTEALIFGRLAAVVGAALILLLIRWLYRAVRKQDGLGLGDVKLLAMVAAFLGFWPAVLTLFLGTLLATVYAVTLLVRRRASAQTHLPFGSFLAVAGLVSASFGPRIIAWYTSLLR